MCSSDLATGFVIAETAHDRMTTKPTDARADGVSPGTAKAPVRPAATTEAANFVATATLPETVPVTAPNAAEAIGAPTVPGAPPEAPSLPTVLRGAGSKPAREDVRRDAEVVAEVGEACRPLQERLTQDQKRPPVTHDLKSAFDRAQRLLPLDRKSVV